MDNPMRSKEEEITDAVAQLGKAHAAEIKSGMKTITDNMFVQGMVPKDALGIGDAQAEKIYTKAYQLYNTGKYKEASALFQTLIGLNVTEPKYHFGLAACLHMLKEYDNASKVYMTASLLDPANPIPHFHSADCYIQMQDPISAVVALEMAIKRSGQRAEYSMLKDRALLTIESLKKEIQQPK